MLVQIGYHNNADNYMLYIKNININISHRKSLNLYLPPKKVLPAQPFPPIQSFNCSSEKLTNLLFWSKYTCSITAAIANAQQSPQYCWFLAPTNWELWSTYSLVVPCNFVLLKKLSSTILILTNSAGKGAFAWLILFKTLWYSSDAWC